MHCGDELVSGLISVVFVYKASLNMAEPFSDCIVVEQRALIRFFFFVARRHKISQIFRRMLAIRKKVQRFSVQGGLFVHGNARPNSAAATPEAIRQLKYGNGCYVLCTFV